ncbi:hypothetical protein [Myroides odoratus]|uniref:hypothetical protein n=1 Tax=Myroides odoratus TaxID=256 RepID=UPI0039AEEDD3
MKIFKITLYSIIFLFFLGCKKIENDRVNKEYETYKIKNFIDYQIKFPDTVYVGIFYEGEINYVSNFDSIIEKFGDERKNRYVFASLLVAKNLEDDIVRLKTVVTDTFGAIDNRLIPIYDISFPTKGNYYIDGIINDAVFIDLNRKDENGENLIRWLEDEVRVTKKVVVIDKE